MEIWKDLKTVRFWRHFLIATFSAVGFFSVVLGLYDVIFPGVLPHKKIGISIGVIAISVAYGTIRSWPRPIEELYSSPKVKISLAKGDLFDQRGSSSNWNVYYIRYLDTRHYCKVKSPSTVPGSRFFG